MNKKHWLIRYSALLLVFAMLVLSGCGNKSASTTPTDPTTLPSEPTVANPTDPTQPTVIVPATKPVKNVIFMIADGGGYDNFTLAHKVKAAMQAQGISGLNGARTQITDDLFAGLGKDSVSGLYLNDLLVGSANTLLTVNNGSATNYKSYITDSAAAGTALATGFKTQYTYVGLDSNRKPHASITELARIKGMSTGIVTTKSYMDATPQTFMTSHSIYRNEYQDNSLQSLYCGVDVVIGEGTEYGDLYKDNPSSHPDVCASTLGYSVARTKTELLTKAADPSTTKLWAAILGVGKTETDLAADHISYDVNAAESAEQPSLLEMTQAALQVLAGNINNPEGFFLMVEGGALDNVAEPGNLRATVGEYLAFDETFGYCVKWAQERGDTIVIAVPDHDSGGFSGIEPCEEALINGIISGTLGDQALTSAMKFEEYKTILTGMGLDTTNMKLHGAHTDMAVPISLYAPDSVRQNLLYVMGLPTTGGQVRTGTSDYYVKNESEDLTWYTSSALNNEYTVNNTIFAPALAYVLGMGSLDDATKALFVAVGHQSKDAFTGSYGGSLIFADTTLETDCSKYNRNTYQNGGLSISRNATTYVLNGEVKEIPKIGNAAPQAIFVLDSKNQAVKGTFYVPASVLKDAGIIQ